MPSDAEFKLSITRALRDQLGESIDALSPAELSLTNLNRLASRPGVYQLYHENSLVYIGKADNSLPTRLTKHYRKISGRIGISLHDMHFKCLYVEEDLSAVAPETLLIQQHKGEGEVPWNYNGFGNNDPGKQRDTTDVKDDHFDARYPIDLAWSCDPSWTEPTVRDVLKVLSDQLPYTFRYDCARKPPDKQPAAYSWPCPMPTSGSRTANQLFDAMASALPSDWQITALPGYVIMYEENRFYSSSLRTYIGSGQDPTI